MESFPSQTHLTENSPFSFTCIVQSSVPPTTVSVEYLSDVETCADQTDAVSFEYDCKIQTLILIY